MRLQYQELKHKQGDTCPSCGSTDAIKNKGMLLTKDSKYGVFLSCSRFPDCKYACKATKTDKRKHLGKKTRRSKKKKQHLNWKKKKEEALKLHKEQKKQRAEDFKNFERLIQE